MFIVALLVIPSAIALIILGLLSFNNSIPGYEWLMCIPLVIGTGAFLLRRAIYEWWISRHPAGLSAKEIDILAKHFPYYQRLGAEHKLEFERRVSVFRDQKKFQMRGAEKVPGDIQLLLSASAIQLTMGFPYRKEFFQKLGAVVMFPRTFITPEISRHLHTIEINREHYDCMLIAVNMFVKGLQNPSNYYDSALYGYAKLFKLENNLNDDAIPYDKEKLIYELHLNRRFQADYIFKYTAIPNYELFEMCSEQFFALPHIMREKMPAVYEYFVDIYQQDPLNYTSPSIQGTEIQISENSSEEN
jgi:Mlc titration factor MtfA (ptsG expression regulator)